MGVAGFCLNSKMSEESQREVPATLVQISFQPSQEKSISSRDFPQYMANNWPLALQQKGKKKKRLDERPNLPLILDFPTENGCIRIPDEIGDKCFEFGIHLLNDETGAIIGAIKTDNCHKHKPIIHEIISRWFRGSGKEPITWKTLVRVLEKIELLTLAKKIKFECLKKESGDPKGEDVHADGAAKTGKRSGSKRKNTEHEDATGSATKKVKVDTKPLEKQKKELAVEACKLYRKLKPLGTRMQNNKASCECDADDDEDTESIIKKVKEILEKSGVTLTSENETTLLKKLKKEKRVTITLEKEPKNKMLSGKDKIAKVRNELEVCKKKLRKLANPDGEKIVCNLGTVSVAAKPSPMQLAWNYLPPEKRNEIIEDITD